MKHSCAYAVPVVPNTTAAVTAASFTGHFLMITLPYLGHSARAIPRDRWPEPWQSGSATSRPRPPWRLTPAVGAAPGDGQPAVVVRLLTLSADCRRGELARSPWLG